MTDNQFSRAGAIIEELLQAHQGGESISSLARKHGLRREAISAVFAEHGVGQPSARRAEVLDYIRAHPGLSIDDLAFQLKLSKSSISRYVRGSEEARLVVSRKISDSSTFSDQEMAQALRSVWSQMEDTSGGLSRVRYNRLRGENTPAASTFIRRYGSWSRACDLAGVNAAVARRPSYRREYSDEDILAAINDYIDETGDTTYAGYAVWATENSRASGPLVIVRLGGWAIARKLAIKQEAQLAKTA